MPTKHIVNNNNIYCAQQLQEIFPEKVLVKLISTKLF